MKNLKTFCIISMVVFLLSACGGPQNIEHDHNSSSMANSATTRESGSEQLAAYTCPMHPHYISTDPSGSCPICGMSLVQVDSSDEDIPNTEVTTVSLAAGMIQTIGVRIQKAKVTELGSTLRAFGTIERNERLENVSVARMEGWIEELLVQAEGDQVTKGQILYRVYSPDLLSAQKDYLAALRIGNRQRISAVEQRLTSLGLQQPFLSALKTSKKAIPDVAVYAEADGTVVDVNVRKGDYIKPGTPILRLQSFENVWVIASIPETDLPLIKHGLSANLKFKSAPDAPSQSRIDYIYPTVNPKTRTARVRLVVPNKSGRLLPGAYVDVDFNIDRAQRLSVPTEAVLRDSRGQHVILAMGGGRFQARTVTVGISGNGLTEIISGLDEGDPVVVSGQFLLDSEVNLREGLSKLAPQGEAVLSDHSLARTAPSISAMQLDAATLSQIDHFVDAALYIHKTIVDGSEINPRFVEPAIELGDSLRARFTGTELDSILNQSQQALKAAQQARSGQLLVQQLDGLLRSLNPWLQDGAPQHYRELDLYWYFDVDSDRRWLQQKGETKNPYGEGDWQLIEWTEAGDEKMQAMPSDYLHSGKH
ncbi:hypothetical protein NBRC116583_15120 [Arenicella sp. 4NH20-0111]|uniref:efflux RND transporter periplasmic adaptor subunit n=1 Tax=Arenicella sp. 4NH20-0111 TaxID=3127648 RepID=UPI0031065514